MWQGGTGWRWWSPLFGLLLATSAITACGGTPCQPLTVLATVAETDTSLVLYRPIDLVWTADGRAYLLNGGDCTVAVFSPDWEFLFFFGGCGEAPGRLSNPTQLLVVDDEIWVVVPRGAVIYDLDGNYRRLQPFAHQTTNLMVSQNGFAGTTGDPGRVGIVFDHQGEMVARFGPRHASRGSLRDFVRRTSWLLLPAAGDGRLLLDTFDGRALLVGVSGASGEIVDLGLGGGRFQDDFHFKKTVSDACRDPRGGYWVVHYPEQGGEGLLYHYADDWSRDGCWALPSLVRPGMVRVSPHGRICLIAESESTVLLCARP